MPHRSSEGAAACCHSIRQDRQQLPWLRFARLRSPTDQACSAGLKSAGTVGSTPTGMPSLVFLRRIIDLTQRNRRTLRSQRGLYVIRYSFLTHTNNHLGDLRVLGNLCVEISIFCRSYAVQASNSLGFIQVVCPQGLVWRPTFDPRGGPAQSAVALYGSGIAAVTRRLWLRTR